MPQNDSEKLLNAFIVLGLCLELQDFCSEIVDILEEKADCVLR